MSKKIIPISKIVLGSLMILFVIIGYCTTPELLIEMTCISNFGGGVILLTDGIFGLKGKTVPTYLYENAMVCLLFVFVICTGSLFGAYNMNFKGVFFFLHTVFPILFILMYIFFVNDSKGKALIKVARTPIFMIVYLLFDFILGKIRGEFVYGFFAADELDFLFALLIGLVFYLFLGLIGWLFIFFNSTVHPDKNNTK
ncbi:MAG: hypothetical protein K6E21_01310 [Bacilli bacterium]|nr:hypothetical protein [Bacilli bacterium]